MRKIILILTFITLCQSCISESDRTFVDGGINVTIFNRDKINYTIDGTLYIGAINGDKFYCTDSLSVNKFLQKDTITNQTSSRINFPDNTDGWKPNLDKIKSKSKRGIFCIKLKEFNSPLFLQEFTFPGPILDGINIGVWIENGELLDLDGTISSQDFEIVK